MKKLIIILALLSMTLTANATLIEFDTGAELNQLTIDYGTFSVSGGYSGTFNLAPTVTQGFNRNSITSALVNQDTSPANGGLGVKSGLNGDTDNFEGSFNNNVNYDEILFFDFDIMVNIEEILLNAGGDNRGGGGHQDLFLSTDTDVFGVFVSDDMSSYTSLTSGNVEIASLETLDVSSFTAQYFAIAHVGPTSSIGGYIESIEYSAVPEPSILALMGLGLVGLGFLRRKK